MLDFFRSLLRKRKRDRTPSTPSPTPTDARMWGTRSSSPDFYEIPHYLAEPTHQYYTQHLNPQVMRTPQVDLMQVQMEIDNHFAFVDYLNNMCEPIPPRPRVVFPNPIYIPPDRLVLTHTTALPSAP